MVLNNKKVGTDTKYRYNPTSLYYIEKLHRLIDYPVRITTPRHYSDPVSLDPVLKIPLPPPTPIILQDNAKVFQLVMGYREIYKKRQRIQLLRYQLGIPSESKVEMSKQLTELSMLIARGGAGSSKKASQGKKPKSPGNARKSPSSINKKKTGGQQKLKPVPPMIRPPAPPDPKDLWEKRKEMMRNYGRLTGTVRPGETSSSSTVASKVSVKNTGNKNKKKESRSPAAHARLQKASVQSERVPIDDAIPEDQSIKLDREIDKEMSKEEETKVAMMSIDADYVETPVLEQDFLRDDVPEKEAEPADLVYTSRKVDEGEDENRALIPSKLGLPDERDAEWLLLSDTNSLEIEDRLEANRLYKQKPPWMVRGISYESQDFIGKLKWFLLSSKWTGRSPYYARPNNHQKIMEIVLDRRKELIFFLTSLLLWLAFVLLLQAVIDIQMLSGNDKYSRRERVEVDNYFIFIVFIAGQLAVVAIWSVLLLLTYGLRVAHYINIWALSLTEMETNAGKGIIGITVKHHAFFLLYTVFIVVVFITERPRNFKATMGTLTALLIRNFVPQVLETKSKGYIALLRIVGLIIQIYVSYCIHITYNMIHIMCIVLRNASEMWNLKFALRFGQIPVGESGYLRQLRVRASVVKLWLHHRLLTGLCSQLGEVFAMPIVLMFLVQIGTVILCAVKLFNLAYRTRKRRLQDDARDRFQHSIEFTPTQLEDVISILLVLILTVFKFIKTASFLAGAGQAFRDGFEFVRRKGLILCNSSHERRLVQSLQWSFSAANATNVNVLGFFSFTRETMVSFLSIALILWALIIQLNEEAEGVVVVFTTNCNVLPGLNRSRKDKDGFCRKKVWLLQSEVNNRVKYIVEHVKLNDSLLTVDTRRRKRRHVEIPKDSQPRMHWLAGQKFIHPQYYSGNCLTPKVDLNPWEHLEYYYRHFHEPCYSEALGMKLMVPKLFDKYQRAWIGRATVDCGLSPFPFTYFWYSTDCSGTSHYFDYDDCGWRKTRVDEYLFRGMFNRSMEKIGFQLTSGKVIKCWNIYGAVQRCKRIQELNLEDVCGV